MYYFIREEYGNLPNVKIVCSRIEADIMIGSLIHRLNAQEHLTPEDIRVISTDCDMIVIGYGYKIHNMTTTIDTRRFFNLFHINDKETACMIPEFCGCDYNGASHNLESFTIEKGIKNSIIYKVFFSP